MVEIEEFCKVNIKDDETTFPDMMNVIHIGDLFLSNNKL